jgi:competence protein ComEC
MQYTDIFILNVGRGSCVLVIHPSGRHSMIDINNGRELHPMERQVLLAEGATSRLAALEADLVNPFEWYSERYNGDLWRFILTHPDEDHMSGLRCLLRRESFGTTVFWDLPHMKPIGEPEDYKTTEAYIDRALYELMRHDHPHENLVWPKVRRPERSASARSWDEDNIEILSPSHDEVAFWNERENWNDMSYVLRIRHGERSVLLPGDIEQPGWDTLAAACSNIGTDVLVASHHGRKSGFPGSGVMTQMGPRAVIISSDRLPREYDATEQYRNATSGNVFSTRQHGTIQIRIWDDGELAIGPESDGPALFRLPPLSQGYGLALSA